MPKFTELRQKQTKIQRVLSFHAFLYKIYAQKTRGFKFTFRVDEISNEMIYADLFYVDNEPMLHAVDEEKFF